MAAVPAGRCGIFLAALPRAPHSAGAWLERPLKRRKILLSAHSSHSVKPQSIQQQSSVVCCLQPGAASAPTHAGSSLSPGMGITFPSPDPCTSPPHNPCQSSAIQLSPQYPVQLPAVGCRGHAGKQCRGLCADPLLRGEPRLLLQPANPHVIKAGKV